MKIAVEMIFKLLRLSLIYWEKQTMSTLHNTYHSEITMTEPGGFLKNADVDQTL
jgi:hypothetical protein